MRPLRLEIRGLRSYRATREIDFADVGLVAIVGDTGAGKSSILEAITYALYNGTTWNQRDVKALISDTTQTVTVALDFAVDGRVYRVTRSTSRTAYPPPVHKLECLSDHGVQTLDGESNVNAEIERLIGLDWKGFTSAVILPQGRFQTLLQAARGERTAILKGIFRLDELSTVREHADLLARRLRPKLDDLKNARSQLLPDPAGSAKDAERRKKGATKREKELRKTRDVVVGAQEDAKNAEARAQELENVSQRLQSIELNATEKLRALVPIEAELQTQRQQLKDDQAGLLATEAKVNEELRRAEASGEGLEALSRANQILEQLATSLPQIQEESKRLENERARVASARESLAKDATEAEQLEQKARGAEEEAMRADQDLKEAQRRLTEAHSILERFRVARIAVGEQGERISALEKGLADHLQTAEDARKRLAGAELRCNEAREALDEIRRAHSAAHAAQGVAVGDPCPICSRLLPKGFVAPETPEEKPAQGALKTAEKTYESANTDRANADAVVRQAQQDLEEAKKEAARREAALDLIANEVRQTIPDADLGAEESVILDPLARENEQRRSGQVERADSAKKLRSAAERADAELRPRREAVERETEELARAATKLDQDVRRDESDRQIMPAGFRPEPPLSKGNIKKARTQLETRLAGLRELEDQLRDTRGKLTEVQNGSAALDLRQRQTLDTPRHEIQRSVAVLRERLAGAQQTLRRPESLAPASDLSLEEEITFAVALEGEASSAMIDLNAAIGDSREKNASCSRTVADALQEAGMGDPQELEEAIISAASDGRRATIDLDQAREQEPKAADLGRRISEGQDFVASLEEVAALLTDGRFIGHVVSRKQRALLAVASDIFGSITGGRYGFAEDFQVVDRLSGQPRSAKTLSGGETFLASLALALGLVELAGRSGGRLEALFLDEGFGSLDANVLEEALGELERRASTGRLVGVVSHLRAVAERIEKVLNVTSGPSGSEIRWVTGAERESLVGQELEEGLLT